MRLRINAWLVAASAMAMMTVAGCEPPGDISPVAPPGFVDDRPPTVAPGEEAQAIGEQATPAIPSKPNPVKSSSFSSPPTPIGKPSTTASGLTYETLKEGTGATAHSGQEVTINYTGTLADGTVFDSSKESKPFVVTLGSKKVIDGWEEGVPGMKVGERRKLTIPAVLGYGSDGKPPKIPPNSVLTFDVELLEVK
jgi:FKBP-type peptidyl-prolyl cis-trans isomerase